MLLNRRGCGLVETFFFEGFVWAHIILMWYFFELNDVLVRLGVVP